MGSNNKFPKCIYFILHLFLLTINEFSVWLLQFILCFLLKLKMRKFEFCLNCAMTKSSILFYSIQCCSILFYFFCQWLVKAIVADKAMPPCLLMLWTIGQNLLGFYNSIKFKTVVTFTIQSSWNYDQPSAGNNGKCISTSFPDQDSCLITLPCLFKGLQKLRSAHQSLSFHSEKQLYLLQKQTW